MPSVNVKIIEASLLMFIRMAKYRFCHRINRFLFNYPFLLQILTLSLQLLQIKSLIIFSKELLFNYMTRIAT